MISSDRSQNELALLISQSFEYDEIPPHKRAFLLTLRRALLERVPAVTCCEEDQKRRQINGITWILRSFWQVEVRGR